MIERSLTCFVAPQEKTSGQRGRATGRADASFEAREEKHRVGRPIACASAAVRLERDLEVVDDRAGPEHACLSERAPDLCEPRLVRVAEVRHSFHEDVLGESKCFFEWRRRGGSYG